MQVARPGHSFVSLVRFAVGIVVSERGEISRPAVPDQVVVFVAIEFDEAQLRLPPVNAVVAFGISRHGSPLLLAEGGRVNAIPSAKSIAVPKGNHVGHAELFPGMLGLNRDLLADRAMQHLPHTIHFLDQMLPHEQLPPRADIDHVFISEDDARGHRSAGSDRKQECEAAN